MQGTVILCLVVVVAITVRQAKDIYQINARVDNGFFNGKWHFSFDNYYDPNRMGFGPMRAFNDNFLSPGAAYTDQFRRDFELVTYCVTGEYQCVDDQGNYNTLKKGSTQVVTMGKGLRYREINTKADMPGRFLQMWFLPATMGLTPGMAMKHVDRETRTNRFYPVVSNFQQGALKVHQDIAVLVAYLKKETPLLHQFRARNAYFYVTEGGPVLLNGREIPPFAAAKIENEPLIRLEAMADAEVLLVEVPGKTVKREERR